MKAVGRSMRNYANSQSLGEPVRRIRILWLQPINRLLVHQSH